MGLNLLLPPLEFGQLPSLPAPLPNILRLFLLAKSVTSKEPASSLCMRDSAHRPLYELDLQRVFLQFAAPLPPALLLYSQASFCWPKAKSKEPASSLLQNQNPFPRPACGLDLERVRHLTQRQLNIPRRCRGRAGVRISEKTPASGGSQAPLCLRRTFPGRTACFCAQT